LKEVPMTNNGYTQLPAILEKYRVKQYTKRTWDSVVLPFTLKETIRRRVTMPILYYEKKMEGTVPNFLFWGSQGCGKSSLLDAIQTECEGKATFIQISVSSVCQGVYGESEQRLQNIFDEIRNCIAEYKKPFFLLLDEMDALCPDRMNSNVNEATIRLNSVFLQEMGTVYEGLTVIGCTNRINCMDDALKSRIRGKYRIPMLSVEGRKEKIKQQLQKFNHSFGEADFQEFALQLKGRSGRDIDQITNELKDIEMALLEKAEYYLPVEQGNGRTLYRPLKEKIDGARKMTFKEDVNRYCSINCHS